MARTTIERLFDSFFIHQIALDLQKLPGVHDACHKAYMAGRAAGRVKPTGRKPKFSMQEVVYILALYHGSKRSVTDIAKLYRVSPGVITKIIEGKYIPNLDP